MPLITIIYKLIAFKSHADMKQRLSFIYTIYSDKRDIFALKKITISRVTRYGQIIIAS